MTALPMARWIEQQRTWPTTGRHVLACHDDRSIIVYQAYRREIADYAITHQRFGGDFRLSRMSWIKPSFLWMMYRSGWATKPDQERVLAIRLPRPVFDTIVTSAVASSYDAGAFASEDEWRQALQESEVLVQWDPDHDPHGRPLERRAVQLGLRGATLRRYATEWPIEILDITEFVRSQHDHVAAGAVDQLQIPVEEPYKVECGSPGGIK